MPKSDDVIPSNSVQAPTCAWCLGPLGDVFVEVSHPHRGRWWYHTGCWNDRMKEQK